VAPSHRGKFGAILRRESFPAFLAAGATQFAGPSTALVVLLYALALAYPAGERTTYGAVALALLGLCSALPTLAGAFVAGPLADRHDRHVLMRASNLVSITAIAALAADLYFAPSARWSLPFPGVGAGFYLPAWVALAFPAWAALIATATLFRPAYNTSVPRFVATAELGSANGLIYSVAATVSAVGTLAVGVLLTVAGTVDALALPFALFLATQVALVLVRVDLRVKRDGTPPKILASAREGFAYLFRRRALFEMTVAALVVNLLAAVAFVELALYVASWLGLVSGIWYGALLSAATAGAACGLLAISRLRFEERAGLVLIGLCAAMGLSLLGLAVVRSIWLALPIIFVYGLMPGMIQTVFLSAVQATVPDEVMGRVFAADEVGSFLLVPFGQGLGGFLTIEVGIQGTYFVAGGAMVAFGMLMVAAFGALRGLGFHPGEPQPSASGSG
jgi:hypothetical protein